MNTVPPPEALPPAAGSGLGPVEIQAIKDASDLLRTEANQLAHYLEFTMKTKLTLRTQEIVSIDDMSPHRVVIAIRNEMARMRGISDILLKLLPAGEQAEL